MVIPDRRMRWLAHVARNPGTAQTVAQAIWEGTQSLKPAGPLGRALQEFRRLGWHNNRGWWQWSLPHSATVVHLVHAPKEYEEHLFREALRESQLTALEKRRPRTFGGMGARLGRTLTLSDIATCDTELDKSLLTGVMAGPTWTADRAHRRGLRLDGDCPYCPREVREDEHHLLWRCTAWKTVWDPLLPEIMLRARALKLGPLSEWPPCLRLCGLLPESVVARSGLAQGLGWKKRCRELNRVSRHQIPNSEHEDLEAGRQRDELALAGHQWAEEGNNSLEQFVRKLHGMFKTVRLQEKGRVVRLAVTLMGKAAGRESILPARITNHFRSLVP